MGVVAAWWLKVPHLYDMHSSLPQQIDELRRSAARLLRDVRWLERAVIRHSRVMIVICPHSRRSCASIRRAHHPDRERARLGRHAGGGTGREIRASLGIGESAPIVLYTGTFEAYQGLDLLFAAARIVQQERPDVKFLLVGGKPDQKRRVRMLRRPALGAAGVICRASARRRRSRVFSTRPTCWCRRAAPARTRR